MIDQPPKDTAYTLQQLKSFLIAHYDNIFDAGAGGIANEFIMALEEQLAEEKLIVIDGTQVKDTQDLINKLGGNNECG